LFFTNIVPCYRNQGTSGNFQKKWINNCMNKQFFNKLVEIIEPKILLCLGRETFEGVMKSFGSDIPKNKSYNELIEDNSTEYRILYSEEKEPARVYALAHCGGMGTANRNRNRKTKYPLYLQSEDWKLINM